MTIESYDGGEVIAKAISAGGLVQAQASISGGEDTAQVFTAAGALVPPYDPAYLCALFEHSNSLRSNVDAYSTNIDGFGHRFDPVLNFDNEDIGEKVRQIVLFERASRGDTNQVVSDQDVTVRSAEFKALAARELWQLQDFFEFCCFDHSFVALRKMTRQDLEITGNAYWEILRDGKGDIARFVYLPSYTVRLLPLDPTFTTLEETVRVSRVGFDKVTTRRRMRRYVQVINGLVATYFKTFGDPRIVSRQSGRVYATVEEFKRSEPNADQATELVHFAVHSSGSPYGVPRWIGNLISVLGSRSMEEVNYLYFGNKSVPPLALLVSGGRLSESAVPRIERFIEENLKGKDNFHKILILEAEGSGNNGQHVKIELHPLTQAQQKDELFQQYDERNIDKVGSSFRLPPLLRGDGRDFNRSVADAQLRFAEDQVFQPERDEFDFMMNRKILVAMGVRFWRFQSQTTVTRDPDRLTGIVERLVRIGVLTPGEGRELAGDILNRELKAITDDWTKRPITLTLAGIQTGVEDLEGFRGKVPPAGAEGAAGAAKTLLAVREQLLAEKQALTERRMELARKYQSESPDVLQVPREEFDSWLEGVVDGK